MSITFSTCFYVLKAKFDTTTYQSWINNFISIVNNFNLVIYTDEKSKQYIPDISNNKRIKLVIKPVEDFHNCKYKKSWITNHSKNDFLKEMVDWKVNML